jgi:hypothetical protein
MTAGRTREVDSVFGLFTRGLRRVANHWTKPCDKQNLDVTCAFHGISSW